MKMAKDSTRIKVIHLGSHIPYWIKSMVPASVSQVEEKAWNAYPYVKTIYSCPFLGERFSIVSETRYFDDDGSQENVHNLDAAALKQREIQFVNIAEEKVDPRYYKKEEDPTIFRSSKTERGPLGKDWHKIQKPLMCIYKLSYVEFKVWGLQTTGEGWIQRSMVHDVLLLGHKQAFTWVDEWYEMTIEDLRMYERETKEILDKLVKGDTPKGSPAMRSPALTQKSEKQTEERLTEERLTEEKQTEEKQTEERLTEEEKEAKKEVEE